MNPPSFAPRGLHRALLVLLGILLVSSLRPAADPVQKEHSIFVGLDLTVGLKGKHHRVIGVEKNALRIMVDHKETVIPMALAKDIRVKQGVKLSNLSASVANLHAAEGANRLLGADEIGQIHDAMAIQSMMDAQRNQAVWDAAAAATYQAVPSPVDREAIPNPTQPATMSSFVDIDNKLGQVARNSSERLAGKFGPGTSLNDSGFVVSFELSTPQPLEQCYAAIVVSYVLAGNSNYILNKVDLQPLGALGPTTRKVTADLRGFPPGAELKDYRVAVYSGGLEVATNISARRTEVTRDEAVVFLTVEYLAKHPGETLPPAPVLMLPRSAFVSQLGSAPLDQVIYARVGKDGRIIHLSTDAAGSIKLSSTLSSAADQLAFVPALEKGRPVEGVARFKLADLVASN